MNIDIIFRVAAVGILISILHSLLKQTGRDEVAMLTLLSGLVLVLLMVAKEVSNLFNTIRAMFQF